MANNDVLTIHLLERKLQIKCPKDKVEDLQKAAYYLDGKMREVRDSAKVVGSDHIAYMAALNITYELMSMQQQKDVYLNSINSRIRDLQNRIDTAIEPENMDLDFIE